MYSNDTLIYDQNIEHNNIMLVFFKSFMIILCACATVIGLNLKYWTRYKLTG